MTRFTRRTALLAPFALTAPALAQPAPPPVAWRELQPGLAHGQTRIESAIGDRQLHIVRIDPARFRFRLLTGARTQRPPRTAKRWAQDYDLVAAINAGMFHPSGLPVGFAKAEGRIVQNTITRDKSVFVFNDERARLIDRDCESFDHETQPNALQSIRMISCEGRNVWSQQPRRWSIACMAQDEAGAILFLHARSPMTVHDFIAAIQALPLNLTRCMYLEGGPEATLYAKGGETDIERVGSFETAFFESDDNPAAWPLPNILGVVARAE